MLSFIAGLLTHSRARRSACGNVSGCSTNVLNVLNSAVFAPIPSASVTTAIDVNPGDLRSWRKANLRSFISFFAQRLNRIDEGGAACWEQAREQSGHGQQGCGGD